MKQFKKTIVDGKLAYLYTERINSHTGGSKTKKGELILFLEQLFNFHSLKLTY